MADKKKEVPWCRGKGGPRRWGRCLQAQKVMEGINAKFKSYDSNKDGFLDKKEIIAYSKKDLLRQTVFLGF